MLCVLAIVVRCAMVLFGVCLCRFSLPLDGQADHLVPILYMHTIIQHHMI